MSARGRRRAAEVEEPPADTGPDTATSGGNDEALVAAIASAAKKIEALRLERKGINQQITTIYDELEAQGVPRQALKVAMKEAAMDKEQQAAYRTSLELARQAIRLPQRDLFEE